MKNHTTGKEPPEISDLPADACPVSGTRMRERKARLVFPVNGEKVAVPDALHLRCPKDGEIVLRLDDGESETEIDRRVREWLVGVDGRRGPAPSREHRDAKPLLGMFRA
jgi:hypothetical protein